MELFVVPKSMPIARLLFLDAAEDIRFSLETGNGADSMSQSVSGKAIR
jgi:hypothetical protein